MLKHSREKAKNVRFEAPFSAWACKDEKDLVA
jgi:hypothetical protein